MLTVGLKCSFENNFYNFFVDTVVGSKTKQPIRLAGRGDNSDVINRLLDVELHVLDDVNRSRNSAGSTMSASSSTTPTSGVITERQARNDLTNIARKSELVIKI